MSVLEARHLAKSYRGRQVVRDVNLHVSSGEVVGLLGPNGAGKTTSFYMIVGLIRVEGGSITLNNVDITARSMDQRARMGLGFLPQEASVFRKLTVEENLIAVLETVADLPRPRRERRVDSLLEEFHLDHIRDHLGASLSGGERRRLEIARVLATEPRFVLLDEPFAGVDPISVNDIQQIVGHLSGLGIGALITDHNVRETLGICDRAYIVNDGTIIASGAPDHILSHEQVREVYLGSDFRF
jgi:lipopolysaccharide export system ATP-binding protein